jgi:hypothetical protein
MKQSAILLTFEKPWYTKKLKLRETMKPFIKETMQSFNHEIG